MDHDLQTCSPLLAQTFQGDPSAPAIAATQTSTGSLSDFTPAHWKSGGQSPQQTASTYYFRGVMSSECFSSAQVPRDFQQN